MVLQQEELANANPTRRFFLEVITKDIALEDAILDLIDNSVDGLIRSKGNDIEKIALDFGNRRKTLKGTIDVRFTESSFSISDDCGGIQYADAKNRAFRFGREEQATNSSLSVYGIGMKRALFKIGAAISVKSRTKKDGWIVNIDAKDWVENDDHDWRFPLGRIPVAKTKAEVGTKIEISKLHDEVRSRIKSRTFATRIRNQIAISYALFMAKGLTIRVNDEDILPKPIPLGESKSIKPAIRNYNNNGVSVTIVAGVMQNTGETLGVGEDAGWYVLCNGRVVQYADKTAQTGWGVKGLLPTYQPKHRQFVGIAFFSASAPEKLPWTTTKRGLNPDSLVFQDALESMTAAARPIISLLNKKYPTQADEKYDRPLTNQPSDLLDVRAARARKNQPFKSDLKEAKTGDDKIKIQFQAERTDFERIRNRLRKPTMSGTKVGEYTFNYFLKNEVD